MGSLSLFVMLWLFVLILLCMFTIWHIKQFLINKIEHYISPSWSYGPSHRTWVRPRKNQYIARKSSLNINTGNSTWCFWIHIPNTFGNWRNVFHMSQQHHLANASYARSEDYLGQKGINADSYLQNSYRRPAVFIHPNGKGLHITHDSQYRSNDYFDVYLDNSYSTYHVGLVWETTSRWNYQKNGYWKYELIIRLVVYINGERRSEKIYNSYLIQPDEDALLYFSDTMFSNDGLSIRDFQIFGWPLSQDQIKVVYNSTR